MGVQVVEFGGSAREMGHAHGECFRDEIRAFTRMRHEVCVRRAEAIGLSNPQQAVLDFCDSILAEHERYAPAVYAEFVGIAEGANLSPAELMIGNGLTDIIDVFRNDGNEPGGCTAWLAAPEATVTGAVLAGQTWDMHPWAQDFMVVIRRRPSDGPASLALTTVGCLSLVGLNEECIAIGNNNLRPTDARVGVMYLAIIHCALAQRSLAAAVNAVTLAHRLSGHNYYLAGPGGEIVDIETTAAQSEVICPAGTIYVHTNHYLTPRLVPFEYRPPNSSSLYRLSRMLKRLHDMAGGISPGTMMTAMADESGQGDCRICRTDPQDKAPTCAAVVISPTEGKLWASKGPPSRNKYTEISL
jgi:isopenicillin-N N-acyltransferase like protein